MRRQDKTIAIQKANMLLEQRANESFEGFKMPVEKVPTMRKLINTAVKDGYVPENESSAQYIMDAAKEIGGTYDALQPEEQKALRGKYYDLFLKKNRQKTII